MVVLTIVLFAVTHFVTRAYERRQDALARRWFAQGQAELHTASVVAAIADLRTALAYSKENYQYRLTLAQALAAAGHTRQARAYLLALWDQQPGNGTVNLQLGRLAAREGNLNDAMRYFHGAIYGVWDNDPAAQRRSARLELIQFLLRENARPEAQSELIALAADLPDNIAVITQVAGLMMRAGEAQRALDLYNKALSLDSRNAVALAGAGQAAFVLTRYRDAQQYLRRAVPHLPKDAPAVSLLETVNLVLERDPFRPRLSREEQSRRLSSLARQVQDRLQGCAQARGEEFDRTPPQTDLQKDYADLHALLPQLTPRELRRNSDRPDTAMDLMVGIEERLSQQCGPPDPADQALLLIARQREGTQP